MELVGRILTLSWVALFLGGCAALVLWLEPGTNYVAWGVVVILAFVWLPISFAPFALVSTILGAAMWGRDALRK